MSILPENVAKNAHIMYNKLPGIDLADKTLRQQLERASITLQQLLLELAPLFSQVGNARYSVWLPHRHFELYPGELMVERGNTMAPMIPDPSLPIVATRWNSAGDALENQVPHSHLPPPLSSEFMSAFRKILDSHQVENLGVAYTQMPPEGHVYLETTSWDSGNRTHNTTLVTLAYQDGTELSTAWIPPSSRSAVSCASGSHICRGRHSIPRVEYDLATTPSLISPRN